MKRSMITLIAILMLFSFSLPTYADEIDPEIIDHYILLINEALEEYKDQYAITLSENKEWLIVTTTPALQPKVDARLKRYGVNMAQVTVNTLPIPKPSDIDDLDRSIAIGNVNIRSGPATSFKKLVKLKKGEGVSVLCINEDWAKVEYKNSYGFIALDYLELYKMEGEFDPIQAKTKELAYIRDGQSTKRKILEKMAKGENIIVISVSGKWAKVGFGFGNLKTGYVRLKDLEFNIA